MGSSTGYQKSTSNSSPWGPQGKNLKFGFNEARKLYNSDAPGYYPGQTVAGFSGLQRKAFGMGDQMAKGQGLFGASDQFMNDTISGKYMQNPNDDQVFANVQSKVMPAINSQFAASGRYGSGMQGDTLSRGLTEAYAPTAAANWQQNMDRRMGAAQYAPAAQMDRMNALYGLGQQKQNLTQKRMDDRFQRYSYYKDLPYNRLSQFMSMIGGNYGGRTTSMTPYQKPSLFGQLLGGGLGLLGGFM